MSAQLNLPRLCREQKHSLRPKLHSYSVYQSVGSTPMMKSLSVQMMTTMMNWKDVHVVDRDEQWLSNADDLDGTDESARDINIFFIHRTISSDSWLGWSQRPLCDCGIPVGIFLNSTGWLDLESVFTDCFFLWKSTTGISAFWIKISCITGSQMLLINFSDVLLQYI